MTRTGRPLAAGSHRTGKALGEYLRDAGFDLVRLGAHGEQK